MEYINKILCGNDLEILPKLPSESINCVVTSPPYWGLRDYGIEPVIWDGGKDCKHEWGNKNITLKHKSGETNPGKEGWFKDKGASDDKGNCFCIKCNAWRGSLGLEPTFELYIKHLCDIFDEVKRVLRKDGTCWVNLGDTYAGGGGWTGVPDDWKSVSTGSKQKRFDHDKKKTGIPAKSLIMIPQRFAIEMVNRGWILRNTIIWHKPNCMPSSAKDRFTVDFEYVYFFVKSKKYWFEQQLEEHTIETQKYFKKYIPVPANDTERRQLANQSVIKIGGGFAGSRAETTSRMNPSGRNKRAVWTIPTKPFPEAHFAVYPETLIEPMIQAGCPKGGVVLDPFIGAGTTAVVAKKLGRDYLGIEIKQEYIDMANKRIRKIPGRLF